MSKFISKCKDLFGANVDMAIFMAIVMNENKF